MALKHPRKAIATLGVLAALAVGLTGCADPVEDACTEAGGTNTTHEEWKSGYVWTTDGLKWQAGPQSFSLCLTDDGRILTPQP